MRLVSSRRHRLQYQAKKPSLRSLELERLESRQLLAVLAPGQLPLAVLDVQKAAAAFFSSAQAGSAGARAGALVDDSYEQNDKFSAASNLGTVSASQTINQLVMADSQDWYRFNTTSTGKSTDSVAISFLH